jgi:hypothetical protein
MSEEKKRPISIPLADLKELALGVAGDLRGAAGGTLAVRERFIDVRAALFQRGFYDPVLVRFDSATVPKATNEELADQLTTIVQSLP